MWTVSQPVIVQVGNLAPVEVGVVEFSFDEWLSDAAVYAGLAKMFSELSEYCSSVEKADS